MNKTYPIITLCLLFCCSLMAQPKAGHYSELNNKAGINLFDAINTCVNKGYSSLGYDGLLTAYQKTDVDDDGNLIDMYGGCTFAFSKKCGNYSSECDCYNREHSLPKSWWGGSSEKTNQGCDIFHVVPTDGYVNNRRASYAFGEVSTFNYTYNGNKLGQSKMSSYSGTVFEPRDEYKGDLARGYMGTILKWKLNCNKDAGAAIFNADYTERGNYGLTAYGIELLMKWHREDPVSEKELKRNNAIEETQGNRNPFIDYPELAEYLWGDKAGQTVNLAALHLAYDGEDTNEPRLLSPADGTNITVGESLLDSSITVSIQIVGKNLIGDIALQLTGDDVNYFAVSPAKVTAEQANAGQSVAIIYTPKALGSHTAYLSLSSQDFQTAILNISAKCVEKTEPEPYFPPVEPATGDYVKVTSDTTDWTGIYLIVYETESLALSGDKVSVSETKVAGSTVEINGGVIATDQTVDSYAIRVDQLEDGTYSLMTVNGLYLYCTGNGKLNSSSEALGNTLSYSNGQTTIKYKTYMLKYNKSAKIFRYYGSGQESLQLYRKTVKASPVTEVSYTNEPQIIVKGRSMQTTDGSEMRVYNALGRLVGIGNELTLPAQGLYIIKTNNKTQRILIN